MNKCTKEKYIRLKADLILIEASQKGWNITFLYCKECSAYHKRGE